MILRDGVTFWTRMKIGKSAAALKLLLGRLLTVRLGTRVIASLARVSRMRRCPGARAAQRGPRSRPSVTPNRVVLPRNLRQLFVFQPAILIRFPRQ